MKAVRTKSKILIGFGANMLILAGLVTTLLLHIEQNATQLNQLSDLERTGSLLLEMRQAALSRTMILHAMMLSDDAFFRDEQQMELSKTAIGFIQARNEFEKIPMSQQRRHIWDQSQKILALSQAVQLQVIERLRADDLTGANGTYLEKAVPLQKENIRWMIELTSSIQQEIGEISRSTAESNRRTLVVMIVLGLLGVIIAGLITFFVMRASANAEQSLTSAREEALTARETAIAASQSKSLFLANMSHEIRTPLTAIIGFADALLDDNTPEVIRAESARTISRNGKHLLGLINDILDLSKIESNKLNVEIIDVSPLNVLSEVESLMGSMARDKGLTFNTELTYPIPRVIQSDPTRLRQILFNLLSNAIKFTEKGEVKILCHYHAQVGQLHFEIRDSGIGMSPEDLGKMFQAFTQANASTARRFGGTGLGLNISKRLAQLLGGDMSVTSTQGKGTEFRFFVMTGDVPESEFVYSRESERGSENSPKTHVPNLNGNILLAEDSPDIQMLVSMYIRKTGATVVVAENGQIAIEKALAGGVDLVLMDMQMPVMGGLEAAEWLRNTGYDKPIIALTANAMQEGREEFLAVGVDEFLSKPIKLDEFYATLARHLGALNQDTGGREDDGEYQNLVRQFRDGLPKMLEDVSHAMSQNDLEKVRSIAHKLKGMGGSFGYQEITNISSEIEILALDGLKSAVSEKLEDLSKFVAGI